MSENKESRVCPKCKKVYTEPPALSRVDNETYICSECGLKEALADYGMSTAEQNAEVDRIRSEFGIWNDKD